jgi:uncharacterized protein
MKKELDEILTELRKLIPYINQKYNAASIEVFGSYTKNQQDNKSDLDLLITFSKVPTLLQFIELKNFLSDMLRVNVDLVMKDSLKPAIGKNILNESVPV